MSDVPEVSERRLVVAVVASAVIVVVVAALVALYGVRNPPDFPSLAEQPDPSIPGTIAWTSPSAADERGPCVHAATPATGEVSEVACLSAELHWLHRIVWTSEGEIVAIGRRVPDEQQTAVVVDLDGQVVTVGTVPPTAALDDQRTREDGARVRTGAPGPDVSTVEVSEADGRVWTAVRVEARAYRFRHVKWSPDGEWLLITDSEGRLLVAPADEDAEVRLLTDDLMGPAMSEPHGVAWYVPGETANVVTVDPAP